MLQKTLRSVGLHYYTIIPDLVKNEALLLTRKLGKVSLYKLNEKNPLVKKLLEIDKEMVLSELVRRLPKKAAAALTAQHRQRPMRIDGSKPSL